MGVIRVANPSANYYAHRIEIDQAIGRVLDKGSYVGGGEVAAFEDEFAAFIGAKHAIGVNSGTDALIIALWAIGTGPSREIKTIPSTALATVAAILAAAAKPIMVKPEDANLCVHLYGQAMLPKQVPLIEDCAQACGGTFNGKRLGTFGTLGCFSFYPTKNLGTIGDGGMIVTSDSGLAKVCRQIREYGWDEDRIPQRIGFNSRLDPIQAAILRVKLKYLDEENNRRRAIAFLYELGLPNTIKKPSLVNHCFHLYVIECDKRDELAAYLKAHDIETGIHYPVPIHKQNVYCDKVLIGADLKSVELRASRILSLPMYPELKDEEVDKIIGCVRSFYRQA